jgi:predicted transcriptional regulator
MKKELIEILKQEIGEGPISVDVLVDHLVKNKAIDENGIQRFIIRRMFFKLMGEKPRKARDIELELAAQYEVSHSTVWRCRI